MPTYDMKNLTTGVVEEMRLSFDQYDELKAAGTHKQVLSFPSMIGGVKSLARQTPDGFKDLLKNIKSKRGRAAGNMKIGNDPDAK